MNIKDKIKKYALKIHQLGEKASQIDTTKPGWKKYLQKMEAKEWNEIGYPNYLLMKDKILKKIKELKEKNSKKNEIQS